MKALDRARGKASVLEVVEDPDGALQKRLKFLLARSAATEFGREHRFDLIENIDDYRSRVSPSTYDDLKPYLTRMIEENAADVLFPGRAKFFAQTSGTSGEPKLIAYPEDETEYAAIRMGASTQAVEDDFPGSTSSGLSFLGRSKEMTTARGAPIGSASGYARELVSHPMMRAIPPEVWDISDFDLRYYIILRCCIPRKLRLLAAFNPSTLLVFFDKGTEFGPRLVRDLREGSFSSDFTLGPELKSALQPFLVPSVEAADRLERVLAQSGRFQPKEIWPDLSVFVTWKSGMCTHYLPQLEARAPGCPIFPHAYSSTEGVIAIPLLPSWSGGVPALMESVLEFFPADGTPTTGPFVAPSKLEPGREYRMLLTNQRGLFRYQLDDVSVVEARHGNAPVIAFSHRYGNTSSLTGEKLTEPQINAAMQDAVVGSNLRPRDFQVAPLWGDPPRYFVAVEFEGGAASHEALRDLIRGFDAALSRLNVEYAAKRTSERLAPPELGVLAPGGFEKMRRALTSDRGRSDAQVKIPRLLRDLAKMENYTLEAVVK